MDDQEVLEPIDDALQDAHHFWHECADSYHDPSRFRTNLNALVQALRNVTFRVQSQKASIPGFDAWYSEWQTFLKSLDLMRWLNEARIKVTKKEGLRASSRATVRVTASYLEPTVTELELDPAMPTEALVAKAVGSLPEVVRPHAVVELSRRWEFDDLPGREVLAATAEAIRVEAALFEDLARHLRLGGGSLPIAAVANTPSLDCMTDTRAVHTVTFDPSTGERYEQYEARFEYEPDRAARAASRYKVDLKNAHGLKSADPIQFGSAVHAIATQILVRDKYHQPMFWFRRSDGRWQHFGARFSSKAEKYAQMQIFAAEVEKEGYDAFVAVAEAWSAPPGYQLTSSDPYPDFESMKGRGETLMVYALGADGTCNVWNTPFRRRFGRVVLDATSELSDLSALTFALPIRRAWGEELAGHSVPDAQRDAATPE